MKTSHKSIKEIKNVLKIQAAGLNSSRRYIGINFKKVLDLMFRCSGKIIVTGIGKSGLIAQKISSTLSSTGTPAIYLHPTEALHGSLGVIHKSDVVFVIGKSGESEEILQLLPSIKTIGAKIIALTSSKGSSLAKQSFLVLHIPVPKEACPLNLAPTTSSTIFMVIGDALAIALMKRRGFNHENFALVHPGGQIGKRLLLKVSDVMRGGKNNPVVKVKASMDQLLLEISKKWAGAASVVNEKGRFIGLVTDYDIRKAFVRGRRISDLVIRDVMNSKPTVIYPDQLLMDALKIMESRRKPLTVVPVIDRKNRSVGMFHLHDLIGRGLLDDRSHR